MKNKFFAEGHSRGLRRHPFVHAVFMHLYQTTKGLHVKADAARVVAMLDELFDQIGSSYVLRVCDTSVACPATVRVVNIEPSLWAVYNAWLLQANRMPISSDSIRKALDEIDDSLFGTGTL